MHWTQDALDRQAKACLSRAFPLQGSEGDLCQSPHWGYLIEGEITVTYSDKQEETISAGDLFYWPPGHTLRVGKDAEIILFSPQAEHCKVVNHLHSQLCG